MPITVIHDCDPGQRPLDGDLTATKARLLNLTLLATGADPAVEFPAAIAHLAQI